MYNRKRKRKRKRNKYRQSNLKTKKKMKAFPNKEGKNQRTQKFRSQFQKNHLRESTSWQKMKWRTSIWTITRKLTMGMKVKKIGMIESGFLAMI